MDYPNIFTQEVSHKMIQRINLLDTNSKGVWGSMTVDQMLAHCNVAYELVYTEKHPKPNAFKRFLIKAFAKKMVTGPRPYKKNTRTAPMFEMKDSKVFKAEKERLVGYLQKTQGLGKAHFEGKESHAFGHLNVNEWNNLFYKHLDHHLSQFGV